MIVVAAHGRSTRLLVRVGMTLIDDVVSSCSWETKASCYYVFGFRCLCSWHSRLIAAVTTIRTTTQLRESVRSVVCRTTCCCSWYMFHSIFVLTMLLLWGSRTLRPIACSRCWYCLATIPHNRNRPTSHSCRVVWHVRVLVFLWCGTLGVGGQLCFGCKNMCVIS